MIYEKINALIKYAIECNLLDENDKYFAINTILDCLNLDEFEEVEVCDNSELEEILADILSYAVENNIIEDNITAKDLFDTRIMSAVTPRPSQVIEKFNSLYNEAPEKATDYFYKLSCDCDYIRRYRIVKDIKWVYPCEYGNIDITINFIYIECFL